MIQINIDQFNLQTDTVLPKHFSNIKSVCISKIQGESMI